jgi:protocadherin alpha
VLFRSFFNKKEVTGNDKKHLSKLGEYLISKFGDKLLKPMFITFSAEFEDYYIPENISGLSLLSSNNREINSNIEEIGLFFKDYFKQLTVKGVYQTWDDISLAFDLAQNKHGFSLSKNKRNTSSVLAFNFVLDWEKLFSDPESFLWEDSFWLEYVFPILFDDSIVFATKTAEIKRIIINFRSYAAEYAVKAQEASQKQIKKLHDDMLKTRESINALISDITTSKRRIDEWSLQIVSLEKEMAISNIKDKLLDEFERASKLVQNLEITDDGKIILYMHPVAIDGDGPLIGPYKVSVDSAHAEVHIENTGNPKEGYAHPHCQQNHKPCFGNYTDLYYHISKFELSTVIELLNVFLGTFNPDDVWGQNLGYWDKEYMFKVYTELKKVDRLEGRWNDAYHKWAGKNLPGIAPEENTTCSVCGATLENCSCHFCGYCGQHEENCTCEWCDECDRNINECTCPRCSNCDARVIDCECGAEAQEAVPF